jgi:hypothetical protein
MDYQHSVTVLRACFRLAIQQDDFSFNRHYDIKFHSVRSFIRYLATLKVSKLVYEQVSESFSFNDISVTISELLSCSISRELGKTSVQSLALEWFCLAPIQHIAWSSLKSPDICSDPRALFDEYGVSNAEEWVAAVAHKAMANKISNFFIEDFLNELGHRTLHSFFIVPKSPDGFSLMGAKCQSDVGIRLKPLVESRKSGTVNVAVSRHNRYVGTDAVIGYEWHATLHTTEPDKDEARACGMVYVFRGRNKGIPIGNRTDLVLAADAVADIDVLQVHAFLEQNVDAELLLRKSDPCFVWLWERRGNAKKGRGAECLRVALRLLRKRFKYARTIVFNIKPPQFLDWSASHELPAIDLGKREATESIMSYVEKLDFNKFEVRFMSPDEVGSGQAAHLAIAKEFQRES